MLFRFTLSCFVLKRDDGISGADGIFLVRIMDVLLNGLSISAEGELQSLCCMMGKKDVTSMSPFGC